MHRIAPPALLAALLAGPAQAGFKPSKASDEALLSCLDDSQASLRRSCIVEIERRELLEACDELSSLARQDLDREVRAEAIDALKELGADQLAVVAETMAVVDPDPALRSKALVIIERHLPDSSAYAVLQAMQDAEPKLRRKAIIIVGKRGFSGGEAWLLQSGILDGDPQVVVEAWRALVRLGNPDTRPAIHQALAQAPQPELRRGISRVLRENPQASDRDPLLAALDDPDTHVQRNAAKALAELGDASVAPILREKADQSDDESVRKDLNNAAVKLGG